MWSCVGECKKKKIEGERRGKVLLSMGATRKSQGAARRRLQRFARLSACQLQCLDGGDGRTTFPQQNTMDTEGVSGFIYHLSFKKICSQIKILWPQTNQSIYQFQDIETKEEKENERGCDQEYNLCTFYQLLIDSNAPAYLIN